jgi:hypothetical protein
MSSSYLSRLGFDSTTLGLSKLCMSIPVRRNVEISLGVLLSPAWVEEVESFGGYHSPILMGPYTTRPSPTASHHVNAMLKDYPAPPPHATQALPRKEVTLSISTGGSLVYACPIWRYSGKYSTVSLAIRAPPPSADSQLAIGS